MTKIKQWIKIEIIEDTLGERSLVRTRHKSKDIVNGSLILLFNISLK